MKLWAYNIRTEFIVMFTVYFLTKFHKSSTSVPLRITVQLKEKLKIFKVNMLFVSISDKVV